MSSQECSLMFFQKNISEDLELDKRLKISRTTCYIIFNFFISTFIFYFFIYYYLHRSCALTICLSYHYIYLSIVFNFLKKSYTHSLICKTQRKEKKKKTKRTKWKSTQRCVFQICYRVSICWLHHRFTFINVIDNLISHSINSNSNDLWKCFWHDSVFRRFNKLWQ